MYKEKYEVYRKYVDFINDYRCASNAATGSKVDSNANVEHKNITTCAGELVKKIKSEIEKITLEKGLGRVYVNVTYDCIRLEKEFIIKYSNGYTRDYYKKEIEKIYNHIDDFAKRNNLYEFYLSCHILLK